MMKSNSTHLVFGTLILEIRLVIWDVSENEIATVNFGQREYFKK